jgi:hypothetical protein
MISIGTSDGENRFIGIEHLTEKEVGEFRTSAKSPLLSGPMQRRTAQTQSSAQLAELALADAFAGFRFSRSERSFRRRSLPSITWSGMQVIRCRAESCASAHREIIENLNRVRENPGNIRRQREKPARATAIENVSQCDVRASEATIDKTTLDPVIRLEVGLRLARIAAGGWNQGVVPRQQGSPRGWPAVQLADGSASWYLDGQKVAREDGYRSDANDGSCRLLRT